jgi:hypothetical protein
LKEDYMTFVIDAFVAYHVGCAVLKIHNDFMTKWRAAVIKRAEFLERNGLQ